jgi:hypothetical protein
MTLFRFIFRFVIFVLTVSISFQPTKAQALIKLRSTLSVGGPSNLRHSAQQSIGQSSVIDSYRANGYVLRQGFIQPFKSFNTGNSTLNLPATISPNPFSANVVVSFSETIAGDLYVTLYDLYGQSIYGKKHESVQELNLDFSYLASGVYFIKITTSRKQLTAKLIKE